MSFETSLYDDLEDEPIISFAAPLAAQKETEVISSEPAPVAAIDFNESAEAAFPPVIAQPFPVQNQFQNEEDFPIAMCKMFVGGLKWETTTETFRDHFAQFGSIKECIIMKDPMSGKSRGFGFVTFSNPKTLDRVLKQDHNIDGKLVDPKRAVPQENDGLIAKIFVGGVPIDVDNETLAHYFTSYGLVLEATLMIDRNSGRSRGFGFVTFDDISSVDALLEEQKRQPLMMRGKKIEVKPATPRNKTGPVDSSLRPQFHQNQERQFNDRYNDESRPSDSRPSSVNGSDYRRETTSERDIDRQTDSRRRDDYRDSNGYRNDRRREDRPARDDNRRGYDRGDDRRHPERRRGDDRRDDRRRDRR